MNLISQVADRTAQRIGHAVGASLQWLVPTVDHGIGLLQRLARVGLAFSLLAVRLPRAVLEAVFDAAGYVLGGPLCRLPPRAQWAAAVLMLMACVVPVTGWPAWMLTVAALLYAVEVLLSFQWPLARLPRLLLAPAKSLASVGLPAAAWTWNPWLGWLFALISLQLTRSAFAALLEGFATQVAAKAQRARDEGAADLVSRLARGDALHPGERVIIYLRPFGITNVFRPDPMRMMIAARETGTRAVVNKHGQVVGYSKLIAGFRVGLHERPTLLEAGAEYEMLIESALRQAGSFVALGRPGEALGAGRISTDEAGWQAHVIRLVEAATLCVLVPAANGGTVWEVRHIVDGGYLSKCCVLMPPAIGSRSFADEWTCARKALADVLSLPAYDARGCVIRFAATGEAATAAIALAAARPSTAAQTLARAVQSLFPELPIWEPDGQEGWLHEAEPEEMPPVVASLPLWGARGHRSETAVVELPTAGFRVRIPTNDNTVFHAEGLSAKDIESVLKHARSSVTQRSPPADCI